MQKLLTLAVIVGFLILSSCGKSASNFKPERTQTASAGSDGVPEAKLVSTDEGGTKQLQHSAEGSPNLQKISLTNAENAESANRHLIERSFETPKCFSNQNLHRTPKDELRQSSNLIADLWSLPKQLSDRGLILRAPIQP